MKTRWNVSVLLLTTSLAILSVNQKQSALATSSLVIYLLSEKAVTVQWSDRKNSWIWGTKVSHIMGKSTHTSMHAHTHMYARQTKNKTKSKTDFYRWPCEAWFAKHMLWKHGKQRERFPINKMRHEVKL